MRPLREKQLQLDDGGLMPRSSQIIVYYKYKKHLIYECITWALTGLSFCLTQPKTSLCSLFSLEVLRLSSCDVKVKDLMHPNVLERDTESPKCMLCGGHYMGGVSIFTQIL